MLLKFLNGYSKEKLYEVSPSECGGFLEVTAVIETNGTPSIPPEEPEENGLTPETCIRQSKEVIALIGCGTEATVLISAGLQPPPLIQEIEWWLHLDEIAANLLTNPAITPMELTLPGPGNGNIILGEALLWKGARFNHKTLRDAAQANSRGYDVVNLQEILTTGKSNGNKSDASNHFVSKYLKQNQGYGKANVPGKYQSKISRIAADGMKAEFPPPSKDNSFKNNTAGRHLFLKLTDKDHTLPREELENMVTQMHPSHAWAFVKEGTSTSIVKNLRDRRPYPPLLVEKIIQGNTDNSPMKMEDFLESVIAWEAGGAGGAECQERLENLFGQNPWTTPNAREWMECHKKDGIPEAWVKRKGNKIFWNLVKENQTSEKFVKNVLPFLKTPAATAALEPGVRLPTDNTRQSFDKMLTSLM